MASALKVLFSCNRSTSSTFHFCARSLSHAPKVHSGVTPQFDVVVVGGGIVGCATARQLKITNPDLKIALVEKEDHLAPHQSGNNSGVLHAGIYYQPGSLKAKLCVRGIDLVYDYCDKNKVPYNRNGKLIVAVEPEEIPRLQALFERAQKNNCKQIEMIDGSKIKDYASHIQGLKAIWSPYTGIIDWGLVTRSFAGDFEKRGGTVYTSYPLRKFSFAGESTKQGTPNDYPLVICSDPDLEPIHCKYVITCAGLHSDRVARLSGCPEVPKIIPFRGEYLLLTSEKKNRIKTNVYPVPDPRLPFLGVHFTPRMNGDVWLGPNAVLAYKREGYSYFSISPSDIYDALSFRGMQKLVFKYFGYGMKELYRGIWIRAQVKQLQRFMPDLSIKDVERGPSGVRAQAMDAQGNLVDDFVFDSGDGDIASRILHVRNAPSPGATSSLAIAEMINDKVAEKFNLKR
uniref:L-2-hydroxyglutarate dehydrogenase, mitochondrial n=1 Tax=Ascaris suum TaxID=6253 RepID=F1L3J1_ASCSU